MSNKLLIGADPEFFVKKDGKFISAYGLIEGTKKSPQKVLGGAVQVDGMALEININPAETFEEFEGNYQSVMRHLRAMVSPEYEFSLVPVADFDPNYIKQQPEEARALGCDPDFNAYTGEANNPPDAAKNFRTASGHFHLGWTEDEDIKNPEHIEACQMMTIQLDAGIGLKGLVYDPDPRRRELYGKAGAYRPKPYGVEYRVLSNFWLDSVAIRQELFKDIKWSYDQLIGGMDYNKVIGQGEAQRLINQNDVRYGYEYAQYTVGRTDLLKKTYNNWVNNAHTHAVGPEKAELARQKRGVKRGLVDFEIGAGGLGFINNPWNLAGEMPPAAPRRAQGAEIARQIREDEADVEAFLAEIGAQNA